MTQNEDNRIKILQQLHVCLCNEMFVPSHVTYVRIIASLLRHGRRLCCRQSDTISFDFSFAVDDVALNCNNHFGTNTMSVCVCLCKSWIIGFRFKAANFKATSSSTRCQTRELPPTPSAQLNRLPVEWRAPYRTFRSDDCCKLQRVQSVASACFELTQFAKRNDVDVTVKSPSSVGTFSYLFSSFFISRWCRGNLFESSKYIFLSFPFDDAIF